jgi:predicted metalloendopeptidase
MKTARRDPFLMPALACALILFPLLAARPAAPAKDALPTGPAVNLSYMERTVRPGDDFYQYANGAWLKHTEIPADRGVTSPALPVVDETDKRVADLITEAAKSGSAGGEKAREKSRKIADLYNSYMDEAGIEARGLKPLQPHLAAIAAIHDKRELARRDSPRRRGRT